VRIARIFVWSDGRPNDRDAQFSMSLEQLVAFLRHALLDPRATPEKLRHLAPDRLPSGRRPLVFQFQP
jgi:hypothetical protein